MKTEMSPPLDHTMSSCDSCMHLESNSVPRFSTPVTVYPTAVQNTSSSCRSPKRIRMVAKFYETNFGHYILLNQDKMYGSNAMYMNLKNTSVQCEENERKLRFVSKSCDGMSLTIGLSTDESLQKWMRALHNHTMEGQKSHLSGGSKSPAIPRSPLMPTLTEDDEE